MVYTYTIRNFNGEDETGSWVLTPTRRKVTLPHTRPMRSHSHGHIATPHPTHNFGK